MDLLARVTAALTGRYAVERLIGHGGMATVFLAHDVRHQRLVAVKVLRPDLSVTLGAERFLREIRITAQLNHPTFWRCTIRGKRTGCSTT
jgi:serine/threonine-protein kinase